MYTEDTNCCAIQELCGLGGHVSAKEAMISFCENTVEKGSARYHANGSYKGTKLYSYYFFTAGLSREDQKNYGAQFAAYIEKQRLGEVIAAPVRGDNAFHEAEHWNQVWIWMPDKQRVEEWWQKQKKEKKS